MHELSTAICIFELAEEAAERHGVQVNALYLKLGTSSGVVKGALLSSYEMAWASTALQGSRLLVEVAPIVILCPRCRAQRPLSSIQLFCCSECRTQCSAGTWKRLNRISEERLSKRQRTSV